MRAGSRSLATRSAPTTSPPTPPRRGRATCPVCRRLFIEVGSAEPFRDEDTEYALRIWATGGQAELHVWAGAFHGFDMYVPDWPISKAALETRNSWLRRIFGKAGK